MVARFGRGNILERKGELDLGHVSLSGLSKTESVPPGVDRIFADYLAVRATRSQVVAGQSQADVPLQPKQDFGILALPPSRSSSPPPEVSGPLGVLVTRPVGEHIHELELTRGVLNVVRVTAFQEATGALALRFSVETEALERPAP